MERGKEKTRESYEEEQHQRIPIGSGRAELIDTKKGSGGKREREREKEREPS